MRRQPTVNTAAYDAYLRAKELLNADVANREANMRAAERLLEEAIQRDPNFLFAHCALARVHDLLYEFGADHSASRLALAQAQIDTALRINPKAGEAHLAQAIHILAGYRDSARAEKELAIAARDLPNNVEVLQAWARIQRSQSKWQEAAHNLEKATTLSPRNIDVFEELANTYDAMRRYPDLRHTYERERLIPEADFLARWGLAWTELNEKADPAPARALLPELANRVAADRQTFLLGRYFLALLARDKDEAERALALIPPEGITSNVGPCPRAFYEGLAAACFGERIRAQPAFAAARSDVEKIVQADQNYAEAWCLLGMIDAGLVRKEETLHAGHRALELMPISKSATTSANLTFYFAVTAAQLGEKALAIEYLERVSRIPCGVVSYGWVKLLPIFDPLRAEQRFEAVAESFENPVP
jgi:tetratricopeptide (TPR) repeat protein